MASNNIMQFVKYIISGSLNTAISLILIYFLYKVLRLDILLANAFAYFFGFLINFWLMKKFVFQSRGNAKKKFILFLLAFILSVSMAILFLSIFIKVFSNSLFILQILTMLLYSTVMYFLSKHIFRDGK